MSGKCFFFSGASNWLEKLQFLGLHLSFKQTLHMSSTLLTYSDELRFENYMLQLLLLLMIMTIAHVHSTHSRLPTLSSGIWWMITWKPMKSVNDSFLGASAATSLLPFRCADLGFVPNTFLKISQHIMKSKW